MADDLPSTDSSVCFSRGAAAAGPCFALLLLFSCGGGGGGKKNERLFFLLFESRQKKNAQKKNAQKKSLSRSICAAHSGNSVKDDDKIALVTAPTAANQGLWVVAITSKGSRAEDTGIPRCLLSHRCWGGRGCDGGGGGSSCLDWHFFCGGQTEGGKRNKGGRERRGERIR